VKVVNVPLPTFLGRRCAIDHLGHRPRLPLTLIDGLLLGL
jgi:hypothetical protein